MPTTQEGRVSKARRSQTPTRRVHSGAKKLPLVERTNNLTIQEFISQYISPPTTTDKQEADNPAGGTEESPPAEQPCPQNQPNSTPTIPLEVYSAASISDADLDACLDLIELTSSEAYAASGAGWSRPKKRKEMKLPDMKYLIVRGAGHEGAERQPAGPDADKPKEESSGAEQETSSPVGNTAVLGFLSFMVTYEDGKEVIYCYEIHLSPAARGRGLGGLLMGRMEEIGRSVGLEKAMLTVFKSNETARRFYEHGGYGVDESSPQPRRLRNGTIKEFEYLILSKKLR